MNKQIYEFFRELFLNKKNNEILAKYFENPIIIGKKEFRLRILKFFENYFIKKNNTGKIPDDEYQPYKEILIKFARYSKERYARFYKHTSDRHYRHHPGRIAHLPDL